MLEAGSKMAPETINDLSACLHFDLLATRQCMGQNVCVSRLDPCGFASNDDLFLFVDDIVVQDARYDHLVSLCSISVQNDFPIFQHL